MQGLFTALVIGLGAWSFYYPQNGSWIYIVLVVVLFQGALAAYMGKQRNLKVTAGEPPYHFTEEEAQFVRRHRFAFEFPVAAQTVSSMLAATGLISLALSPWLAYQLQWTQAVIVGLDVALVGYLTRQLNPKYTLVLAAHHGKKNAAHEIELFNGAWRKILDTRAKKTAET